MSFHKKRMTVLAAGAVAVSMAAGFAVTCDAAAAQPVSQEQTPPSVAGYAYNALPYNNPDIKVTQIDNSDMPAYLRNPIGQKEGIGTPDDLSDNYYSADAAPMAYDGKLFVYTGHDEASPTDGTFVMKDWGVYVTDNPESGKWTHYKNVAKADLFDWATGDGAYAGQVVADDGGTPEDPSDDCFYYYIPVKDRNAKPGADPFSIGVATSRSPLGPWKDAIGHPLLTTAQTQIETIDPAFFVDNDGSAYMHFGTFNSQLAVKMAKDQRTGRTSFTQLESVEGASGPEPKIYQMRDEDALSQVSNYDPKQDILGSDYARNVDAHLSLGNNGGAYANGPKGFFEASWVFHKGDTYYNVYDGGKPGSGHATCVESNYQACIEYSSASSPLGPWKYQGKILDHGSATTMHPSVVQFGGKWWVTYHTADKKGGTDFRRALCIDTVDWNDGRMTSVAHPTKAEKIQPSRNVAPYAIPSATFTETASFVGSLNDGRVLQTAVVPADHWTNYRSIPQPQSSDSLIYQWDGQVRIDSSKVFFDVDSNALRAPQTWKLQYLTDDGAWKDVGNPSAYTVQTGKGNPNVVTFDAVTTSALKLDLVAQPVDGGYASVGVPEWEVYGQEGGTAMSVPALTTATGSAPQLPARVPVSYGSLRVQAPVIWRPVDAGSYAQAGSFTVPGVVAGLSDSGISSSQDETPTGNVQVRVNVVDHYAPAADVTAPVAKVALAGTQGRNGWVINHPVALVSAVDDSAAPASRLELKIGDQDWRTIATGANTAFAGVDGEGRIEVQARAVDAASNSSSVVSQSVDVDSRAPTVTANLDSANRAITLNVDDQGGSGVDTVEFRRDKGAWERYADGQTIKATGTGRETVSFRAADKAGNMSIVASKDIPSDRSVPLTGYIEKDAVPSDPENKASGWTKGVAALNDGVTIPDGCQSQNECIWGSWPNTGTIALEYAWDREVTIDSSRVQFTSDGGGLAIPQSWKLQYWDAAASAYVDIAQARYSTVSNVPDHYGDDHGGWSEGTWKTPVKTTKLRLVMESGSGSPALAEWQVHAPESVNPPQPAPNPVVPPSPSPPVAADKTSLNAWLATVKPVTSQEGRYTQESWEAFMRAWRDAQAVAADGKASQSRVDAALRQLKQAYNALVVVHGGDSTTNDGNTNAGNHHSDHHSAAADTSGKNTAKAGENTTIAATGAAVSAIAGTCALMLLAGGALLWCKTRRHGQNR
ncbi:family 43 glycosylhydrolase [Bifidobacterium sp. ESL0704]|uniref:family 43 glycosylhydrolase n=1 Tax=Bifidobacterium sp. ESL0704 TaxID=2983219 RepID=UPI0023F63F18|nr:family 43 glycosylhydrolase [Bifidobacterium sp. ESL0704]WEV53672.1 family 43 glycosylhydrolase [Bifidobacterium sp. ESL0704]